MCEVGKLVAVFATREVNIWREIEADAAGFVDEDTVNGAVRNQPRWLGLLSRVSNSVTAPSDRLEDLVGSLGPDDGAPVFVPVRQPVADVGVELAHRTVHCAAQIARRQPGEPALDEVQPEGAGGSDEQTRRFARIVFGLTGTGVRLAAERAFGFSGMRTVEKGSA